MPLDTDAARVITQAQNMLSGVKDMFPYLHGREAPYTTKLRPDEVISEVMRLLGRRIPRDARAGRVDAARSLLMRAQGMLVGAGVISVHDVELITETRPLTPAQKRKFDPRFDNGPTQVM